MNIERKRIETRNIDIDGNNVATKRNKEKKREVYREKKKDRDFKSS